MINVGSKLRQETFEVDRKYIAFCPLMLIRGARQCNISEQGKSELHLNFTWHGNVGSVQSHSQTFNNFYPSSQEKTVFLKTNREHWRRSQMRSVPLARDDGPRLDTSISIVSLSSSSPRQLPPRPRLSLITGLDNWYCSVLALLSVPARDAQHNNYH